MPYRYHQDLADAVTLAEYDAYYAAVEARESDSIRHPEADPTALDPAMHTTTNDGGCW